PSEPTKGPKGPGEVREGEEPITPRPPEVPKAPKYKNIHLKLEVPRGRISDMARILNFIYTKFADCTVEIEIKAEGGEISIPDYEDKVKEALRQAGIEIKFEANQE
ncbi:MAG: hypothetical protein ACPLF9_08370, partial [Methanothermobacter tenebrarum]